MTAPRGNRNFCVVFVGGPMNGKIEHGQGSLALTQTPDGQRVGMKIRSLMPWYNFDDQRPGIGLEEARRMHALAGVEPWGDPEYALEETTDPDVFRYRYVGEYDPARDCGTPQPLETAPTETIP